MSLNSVSISGRLTRDPQIQNVGQRTVAHFTLAVDRNFYNKNHQIDTDFFRVNSWLNANFVKNFHKGDGLVVHGQLQNDDYQDKNGMTQHAVSIDADQVASAGRSRNNSQGNQGGHNFQRRSSRPSYNNQNSYNRQSPFSNNNQGNIQRPGENAPSHNNNSNRVDPFAKHSKSSGNKKLDISEDDLPF